MIDLYNLNVSEKHKNILTILNHIISTGGSSAADIVASTNLSIATASRTLVLLRKLKLVVSKGKEITDMGRHPDIFSINSRYGFLLHFYMGADYIKGYMMDLGGNVVLSGTEKITRNITIDEFVEKLRRLIGALTGNNEIILKKVLALGIAVPGFVDEKNKVIRRIPNIYNFEGVNLFDRVKDILDVPVLINNQARLSVLGEHFGRFEHCKNMVYIDFTKYSGIGAGIILNGRLHTGKNSAAGEVGDSMTDIGNFDKAGCRKEGCLEATAGLGNLFANVRALMDKGGAQILRDLLEQNGQVLSLTLIEQACILQDEDVLKVFDETMKRWAMAIVNMTVILDPDLVLLGGALGSANTSVLFRIQNYLSKILFYDVDIRLSELGEDAQLLGGIHLLKKHVYNHVITNMIIQGA
jgi:predicted NBD/HSP70 family sugar kinase